jgi:hypothetical protein
MKVAPGTYKHYKGDLYLVVGEAVHTETDETHVVYRRAGGEADPGTLWIRPVKNFCEMLLIDGRMTPRFTWTGRTPDREEVGTQFADRTPQQQTPA